jgi:hypothetical protein
MGTGGVLAAVGGTLVPLLGVALGAAYLASPTWRLVVVVDDDGLEVVRRFRIAWKDVVRVVASPSTKTCFVDGGAPEKSLLVPGVGAPAPYAIENREALYDFIVAHAPKVEEVTTLEAR